MLVVGISLGTRNGANDAMCKEALMAAKEKGADVKFVHLMDWDIQDCTGCVACSRGLVMGHGNICTRKDEFDEIRNIMYDADGIIVVDPIFVCGASGLFHTMMDRFGPRADRAMNMVAHKISEENPKAKDVDPRLYTSNTKISFIGIGGSDWATAIEYDHTQLAMSPMWQIIDNEKFAWSKNIIMEDEKVERVREIGRNMVDAINAGENAKFMGDPGICPHCHCKNFYITPGTTEAACMTCGTVGKLEIVDGAIKFSFTEEAVAHAHDTMSGKFFHVDDIKNNEGQAMANRSDPKFKASQERVASYNIEEILPPSKRQGR